MNGRVDVILNNHKTQYIIFNQLQEKVKVGVVSKFLSLPIKTRWWYYSYNGHGKQNYILGLEPTPPKTLDIDQTINKDVIQKDETTTDYMI